MTCHWGLDRDQTWSIFARLYVTNTPDNTWCHCRQFTRFRRLEGRR